MTSIGPRPGADFPEAVGMCLLLPPHSEEDQARARTVLGTPTSGSCAACLLAESQDSAQEEPGPNLRLTPAGPFFEALREAYRVADPTNRAALKYAFPTIGALIAWSGP